MPPVPRTALILVLGVVFLAASLAASVALSLEHLIGLSVPGCGKGSPCAQAAASVWGKVPLLNWPVSFVGVAYFLALAVAWCTGRQGIPALLRVLVRLGVGASIGFTVIMFAGRYVCPYCLATHAGNVAFWILMEATARRRGRNMRPLVVGGAVFVAATAGLVVIEQRWRQAAVTVAETQMQQSSAEILAASTRPADVPPAATSEPAPVAAETDSAATTAPARPRGFTGRYRLGPEDAPIRFVLFMDYECKGCRLVEEELMQVFEGRDDLSISVKLWPGGPDCNPYSEREHRHACAAARAAEAAGMLGGNDAFWRLHKWLFERSGQFADDELHAVVREAGLDVAEFERVRASAEVQRRVQADIEEGFALGLRSTPTVYVNGREFKGWAAPTAVTRLVQKLGEANLPRRTAEADQPPLAREAYILAWREGAVRELPDDVIGWPEGAGDARVKIVMWGDYQQANTARADGIIREFVRERTDAAYVFHPFPRDPACNSVASKAASDTSCLAARAAVAAGRLGGAEGYWRMHAWLLARREELSEDTLRSALATLGFATDEFFTAMNDPATTAALEKSGQAGFQAGLRNSPLMVVNGKIIPRWLHGEEAMIRPILEAAAAP